MVKVSRKRKMKDPTFIKIDSPTKHRIRKRKGTKTYDEYLNYLMGV